MMDLSFYKGKTVFITGHTGFKGSWMCRVLVNLGAKVIGYALQPPTNPNLFEIADIKDKIVSIEGDIRDCEKLCAEVKKYNPEIVIHMAAQPIVRESYVDPRYTYETNVMGTVNILEAVKNCESVKSFVNVTTDKVYKNREWNWGYRENEELNGYDPYSNSKSCSELVTECYKNSFFKERDIAITTMRAGNVVGGGDFAKDRIIPDCVRAAEKKEDIIVRNPYSTRPYQHVLEPVCAYLMVAMMQYKDRKYMGEYNVGPRDESCVTTGTLVDMFCNAWGEGLKWKNVAEKNAPHEANFLKLDCSKISATFNWCPRWEIKDVINKIVEFYKDSKTTEIKDIMDRQIKEYLEA